MMKKFILWTCAIVMVACTTTRKQSELTASGLKQSDFQTEVDGKRTDLFVLKNKNNMEVCITNFGGRIVSVMVPDKEGTMRDVVLGFDSIQDYIKYPSDFGATIGRYANRINQGRFTLDGVQYQLPQIIMGIACTVVLRDFSIEFLTVYRKVTGSWNLLIWRKMGKKGFPVI